MIICKYHIICKQSKFDTEIPLNFSLCLDIHRAAVCIGLVEQEAPPCFPLSPPYLFFKTLIIMYISGAAFKIAYRRKGRLPHPFCYPYTHVQTSRKLPKVCLRIQYVLDIVIMREAGQKFTLTDCHGTEWMWHRKRRENKQQPSMLPGPAVPGCCLVSLCFLCDITTLHSHLLQQFE